MRGRCLPYGDGVTYWPLAEMLKDYAGIKDSDQPRRRGRQDPARGHRSASTPATDAEPGRDRRVAGLHPRCRGPRRAARRTRPAGVRRQAAPGLAHVLLGARPRTARCWSSSRTSTGPTPRCSTCSRSWTSASLGPVLFVCPSRPDLVAARPELGRRPAQQLSRVTRPAGAGRGRQLVTLLLDVDDLPRSLHARILERAEGNPFFLEEILRRFIDERARRARGRALAGAAGHRARRDPRHGAGRPGRAHRPARPADKRALQAAAVVGRVFWTEPLHLLVGNGSAPASRCCGRLEERDLVQSPARLVARRAGRVHLQAHPDPRRRVRAASPGASAASRTPSSPAGSSGRRVTGPGSSPSCSRTTTPPRSSSGARPAARSTRACAPPRGRWLLRASVDARCRFVLRQRPAPRPGGAGPGVRRRRAVPVADRARRGVRRGLARRPRRGSTCARQRWSPTRRPTSTTGGPPS